MMIWLFIVIMISLNFPTTNVEGSVPTLNLYIIDEETESQRGKLLVYQLPARKWQRWDSNDYKGRLSGALVTSWFGTPALRSRVLFGSHVGQ